MSSEDSLREDEHREDKRGCSRRSSRTPGLLDSDSMSEDGDVRDSEKPEWSEEEHGTKVSTLMCPWPLMITPFQHDMCGPQLTKREMREDMKSVRRLEDPDPDMELNSTLVFKFHKVGI